MVLLMGRKQSEITKVENAFSFKGIGKVSVDKKELFELYVAVRNLHEAVEKIEEQAQDCRIRFMRLVKKK